MTTHRDEGDDTAGAFSRRTFMKASGVAAGAGILGAGYAGAADGDGGFDHAFANARVQEARTVWERGYRGRADRSLALTDSGIEGRHPDLGPWNGVTAAVDPDGGLDLFHGTAGELDEFVRYAGESRLTESYTATTGPLLRLFVHGPFAVPADEFESTDDADARVHAVITWEPSNPQEESVEPANFDMRLIKNGQQIGATGAELASTEERDNRKDLFVNEAVEIDPDDEYEVWVYGYGAPAVYTVDVSVDELAEREEIVHRQQYYPYDGAALTAEEVRSEHIPAKGDSPGIVGWNNDIPRYGDFNKPLDDNGHGTHVSSIMAGTGQASAVDPDRYVEDDANAVLLPGDFLEYEVTADADTGVFASGYGTGYEIVIEGPGGRELARSTTLQDTLSQESFLNNMAVTETTHGSGSATYTVYYRANQGEALPAQVERIACGAFGHHTGTAGDALAPGETDADGLPGTDTVHAGVAPGSSLVGITGLGGAAEVLAAEPDGFASTFNVRAVNMSWGYVGGVPAGAFGLVDGMQEAIRNIAEAGIVTVAAAGNAYTPANGNASPAVVPEAISVVATGPRDGISVFSSGGLGAPDDRTGEPQGKPDVTAIGGSRNDYDMAAYPESGPYADDEFGDVRTYEGLLGTSMASPSVCGHVGLLAQAMEEDAPEALSLPDPATLVDEYEPAERRRKVLQLKSVLLATASETAFTAAPYHKGKAPTYTHGERDPYEGYGRVNPDAAVDAVTRDLLPGAADLPDEGEATATVAGTVGLDVPADSRAIAGYVTVRDGELSVDLEFGHYAGGNTGLTRGDPHLDIFVYDPEDVQEPGGDPQMVASAQGWDGTASLSLEVPSVDPGAEPPERTLLVVAKLVNVPGAVNGHDVRAHVDLDLSFTAGEIPLPAFEAAGDRTVDSSVVAGRQATRVQVTVEDVADDARVYDHVPEDWRFLERFSDAEMDDESTGRIRLFDRDGYDDSVDESDTVAPGDTPATFTYFVESPDELDESGHAAFGPGLAEAVDDDAYQPAEAEFAGQDDALVVAQDI